MNKNKDFIQLPPLPADMDGDAVSILWEYAKMPDEERKHIREYFDMARQKAGEAEAGAEETCHIPAEEAEGFRKALKDMTGDLIVEISQFSCMLYDLIYVKGQKPEILIEKHPESAGLIRIMSEVFADMKMGNGRETDQ